MNIFKKIVLFSFIWVFPLYLLSMDEDPSRDGDVAEVVYHENGDMFLIYKSGILKFIPVADTCARVPYGVAGIKYSSACSKDIHSLAANLCICSHAEFLKCYLDNRCICEINAQSSKYFNTPLHVAALYGNICMATELLSHGADLSITNNCEDMPIDIAIKNGHFNIVKLFFKEMAKGVIKHKAYDLSKTFWLLLCKANQDCSVSDLCIKYAKNCFGRANFFVDCYFDSESAKSSFGLAFENGDLEIVRLIVDACTIPACVLNSHLYELVSFNDEYLMKHLFHECKRDLDWQALKKLVMSGELENICPRLLAFILDKCDKHLPTPSTPWAPKKEEPTQKRT